MFANSIVVDKEKKEAWASINNYVNDEEFEFETPKPEWTEQPYIWNNLIKDNYSKYIGELKGIKVK